MGEVTELLTAWNEGDQDAFSQLSLIVYPELRRIARRHLKDDWQRCTVEPSSLVQEAFLRLLPEKERVFIDRTHFFAVASTIMRHFLVDYARRKARMKRGGKKVDLDLVSDVLSDEQVEEVICIDHSLRRLQQIDERKAKVFELRFFGGLEVEQVAQSLKVSAITVMRDWKFACAWLRRELQSTHAHEERLDKLEP